MDTWKDGDGGGGRDGDGDEDENEDGYSPHLLRVHIYTSADTVSLSLVRGDSWE